jgi:septal ring factor EnvC (AmiA/AmiB activator)
MKESEDEEISQDDLILLEEKKKGPIGQFFQEFEDEIEVFSKDSGEFFLKIKKDVKDDWGKVKASWKSMIKKVKNLDPKYKRLSKLYDKIKQMDSKMTEIKEDTTEIKLEISEVVAMIETMMEGINDIEGYMEENLGSDWKILKNSWQQYKDGEITRGAFIKTGLSKVGKKFAGIFLRA